MMVVDHEHAKLAAQRLFKTSDGEAVLAYLRSQFYDNRFTDEEMARQVGRRDVIWTILNLAEKKDVTRPQPKVVR